MSTKIEWVKNQDGTKGETWNPVVGCTKISPGCEHCFAEKMAFRLAHMALADIEAGRDPGRKRHYLDVIDLERKRWNGKVALVEEALTIPLHWRKARTVFVCSMSDLFHKGVNFLDIADIMQTILSCQKHTFLLLTKRPERMLEYFKFHASFFSEQPALPDNIIGMVTAENQKAADERLPLLVDSPFAVRGVSIEPMIGPIDISPYLGYNIHKGEIGNGKRTSSLQSSSDGRMENQLRWAGLDEEKRQLETCRAQNAIGLSSGQEDDQSCKNSYRSTPSSLSAFQGEDSCGHDNQSYKRNKRRQQTREPGDSNAFRKCETCIHDRPEKSGRTEESSQQVDRSASRRNQREICAGEYNPEETRDRIWCGFSDDIEDSERRTSSETRRDHSRLYQTSNKQDQATEFKGKIRFVIVGGESGPGARPMYPQWVRDVRDQCQEAGVPFFFKQWGDYKPDVLEAIHWIDAGWDPLVSKHGRTLDGREWNEMPAREQRAEVHTELREIANVHG